MPDTTQIVKLFWYGHLLPTVTGENDLVAAGLLSDAIDRLVMNLLTLLAHKVIVTERDLSHYCLLVSLGWHKCYSYHSPKHFKCSGLKYAMSLRFPWHLSNTSFTLTGAPGLPHCFTEGSRLLKNLRPPHRTIGFEPNHRIG